MREVISAIYSISNIINDKIYIGSAIDFKTRKRHHLYKLKNNKHHNIKLQNFVNKHGIDTIIFNIIEIVNIKEDLIKREQYYIDILKPHYNICKIAGSILGIKRSKESIFKQRETLINKKIKEKEYDEKNKKPKQIRLSDEEYHYCEVLKNVYKINPSQFIRMAFREKLKRDIPKIRENNKVKLPF